MGRRRKVEKRDNPSKDWVINEEMQVNGRHIQKGTELKIEGEWGRFRFIKHVVTPTAEWVDVWGGIKHREQMRSFRVEQIKRVHYKNTTDKALAAEYKAKKTLLKAEAEAEEDVLPGG